MVDTREVVAMHAAQQVTSRTPGPHTWVEFLALPDDDRRELLDGHFVEMDDPDTRHEVIVGWLLTRLTNWADAHDAGLVFPSGMKVRVTDRRGAMPDIQFVRHDNPGLGAQGFSGGRPDLAVEILSPSSQAFDRVTKLQWYASIGVPEYWIVDADARTIDRLVLSDGVLQPAGQAVGDATFEPETFPGLALPLAKMWTMGGRFVAP